MSSFPEWLVPMAATLTQERFEGPEWIFERKFDGIRLLAYKKDDDVQLFSRNHLPQHLPPVERAIHALPHHELILDGEITWRDGKTAYHVFDIMWLDGRSVTNLPLEERQELLAQMPFTKPLERVPLIADPSPWERAQREGWEGVIAKRRGSIYEHRRSKEWFKMKCELSHNFLVGGFTDPQGKRIGLGALLVGQHKDGEFVYAGRIGTGFNTQMLLDLRARLDQLEIPKPPFTKAIGLPRVRAHWVEPKIEVRVGFIEWTSNGKLRHPRLLALVDTPQNDHAS